MPRSLVLADLVAYGPVTSGPAAYTHTVGPVFKRAADERKSPEQLCRYIVDDGQMRTITTRA